MEIAVLGGTGPAGSGLAARLASVGYDVVIGSRSKYKAMETVDVILDRWPDHKLSIRADTNTGAAAADVVVIATPWDSTASTALSVADQLKNKVVISMANALAKVGPEFQPLVPPRGSVAASVQAIVPRALVAAAFHHLPAKELGNIKVTTDGPTEAKIDEQVKFIDNYITRGVDGVLFAANDPVAIAPVLKKALSKGIHVVGYDANSTPDAREWFVNQAQFNGIGKAMIDSMAKEIGEDKGFAIVTSTFTTPNQARWIAEMQAYAAKCHPKMKWLETVEAQEDNVLSFNQATTLINKYGDKLSGLFGMTSVATPASAEAVTKANLCGKVAVVGLATPNAMKPYVTKDCVKSVVLWNPVDLGYAATYVIRAVVDGKLKAGATSVDAGKLGKLNVVNGSEILLGSPFIFTKANVKDFDF